MNCKPGDLVVYVGRHAPSLGAMATVIKRADQISVDKHPAWILDRAIVAISSTRNCPLPMFRIADVALRPIRDQDGEDQTLTWAGKPSDIKTPEAA